MYNWRGEDDSFNVSLLSYSCPLGTATTFQIQDGE